MSMRSGLSAAAFVLLVAGVMGSGAPYAQETPSEAKSLAGQLLVATPAMSDPRFVETVIFMVKHDASGAMGLVVNRPVGEIAMTDLLKELGIDDESAAGEIRLHYGGPVDAGRGLVLHSADYMADETQVITDTVSLTAEREIVRAIANGSGPRLSIVTFGYAGWSAGQLEGEIERGGWIAVPADEALVFDDDYEGKWARAMDRLSIEL